MVAVSVVTVTLAVDSSAGSVLVVVLGVGEH